MAFTQYKSLSDVLKKYRIRYEEAAFVIDTNYEPPQDIIDDLGFTFENIAYQVSEASICENLIYPVLKTVYKKYADNFALWSHQPLELNDELHGIPDYMISRRSELGKIVFEQPFVAVIEAKKDDFTGGWAQCCIEMFTIQQINQNAEQIIFGIVSNGETWELGQLQNEVFTMFRQRFDIGNLHTLYNVIASIFEKSKYIK